MIEPSEEDLINFEEKFFDSHHSSTNKSFPHREQDFNRAIKISQAIINDDTDEVRFVEYEDETEVGKGQQRGFPQAKGHSPPLNVDPRQKQAKTSPPQKVDQVSPRVQGRRETFENVDSVTLSFSDSSIFKEDQNP